MDLNLFGGWGQVVTVLFNTVVLYAYVILLLRIGGKRTSGKIATFDFGSIIVIGPLIATTILSSTVTLVDGLAALTAFVALQWLVSYLATRSAVFARIVTSPPTVLFSDGAFLRENIAAQRVHEDEIVAHIRGAGHAGTDTVKAVVLESTGDLSVVASTVPEKPAESDEALPGRFER